MAMKINKIMREQIQNRIANYKETADTFRDGKTDWHKHQVNLLEAKIEQLEWVLSLFPKPVNLGDKPDGTTIEEMFLEGYQRFQKDKNGIYFYISENGMHAINVAAILEEFKQHIGK